MTKYCLLTGATGLLGRYLLRYLLLRDYPLAVLIRGNRTATARQRLETILVDLEGQVGHSLPRPFLLVGDLSTPGLGLSGEDRAWVRRRVGSVLHNAASLTFENGEQHEEPWKTNLTGTQLLLQSAEEWGIRQFHHVSTAYVCGKRRGRVYEHELAVGQAFGNDYEASKLRAEQLVQEATWLDSRTIYRPAIIVGDSVTGFSNTFHGFYTPLRIVHMLIHAVSDQALSGDSLVKILGLRGNESKNLVPVDWVGAVIGHLMMDDRHHGHVYHVTPDERTSVSQLCEVMERAVNAWIQKQQRSGTAGVGSSGLSLDAFLSTFRDKMQVYQAYWRDDPEFDATQRLRHAGNLPCPVLTGEVLLRLCEFALKTNFCTSRGERVQPEFDINQHCSRLGQVVSDPRFIPSGELVQLRVTGCGGGDWALRLVPDGPVTAEPGIVSDHHLIASMEIQTMRDLVAKRLSFAQATCEGRVCLENCHRSFAELRVMFDRILCLTSDCEFSTV